jgi:hypothetical protein
VIGKIHAQYVSDLLYGELSKGVVGMKVKELIEELMKMPQDAEIELLIPVGWENATSEPCSVTLRTDGIVEII